MSDKILVERFTVTSRVDRDTVTVYTFGDGVLIREDLYSTVMGASAAEENALTTAKEFGVLTNDLKLQYELKTPAKPVTPETPPPPTPAQKDRTRKRERYLPEHAYSKPKSTAGGDFIVKETGDDYKGTYIETSGGKYYSGTSPEQNGAELVKTSPSYLEDLMPLATGIVGGLLSGLFQPRAKKGDKQRGFTKRYFIQDKRTNKIVETDQQTYIQAKTLPSKRFAEIDWIVKGPAQDRLVNGYPYEGAISKNKKTVMSLEKQLPGISAFVTDYALLVEEPYSPPTNQLTTTTTVVQDPETALENSRKANFDLRR